LPIFAPTIAGSRGHPVLFPWPLSKAVFQLAPGEGLNALVARQPLREIDCTDLPSPQTNPFLDIDTPEQYRALTR
jgi:CTP:molybdopterin cytidylyltransferase MocA